MYNLLFDIFTETLSYKQLAPYVCHDHITAFLTDAECSFSLHRVHCKALNQFLTEHAIFSARIGIPLQLIVKYVYFFTNTNPSSIANVPLIVKQICMNEKMSNKACKYRSMEINFMAFMYSSVSGGWLFKLWNASSFFPKKINENNSTSLESSINCNGNCPFVKAISAGD